MAGSEVSELSPAEVYAPPQRRRHIPTLVWLLLVLAAVAGGYYAGSNLGAEAESVALAGKVALDEAQLDAAVATYVVDGQAHTVTAREALAQQGSLEAAKNADGSYAMPSAESIVAAARTAILMADVERQQIEVSDDEVTAYLQETFGTDDTATLASAFGMDGETLHARLVESASVAKLRAAVVEAPGELPAEPTAPDKGKEDEATEAYASYIIALAGDEWNSDAGTWAADDGPYAIALHDFDVRSDAATYEAARTAFDVAYQLNSAQMTAADTQWTSYVNGLLSQAQLTLATLGT